MRPIVIGAILGLILLSGCYQDGNLPSELELSIANILDSDSFKKSIGRNFTADTVALLLYNDSLIGEITVLSSGGHFYRIVGKKFERPSKSRKSAGELTGKVCLTQNTVAMYPGRYFGKWEKGPIEVFYRCNGAIIRYYLTTDTESMIDTVFIQ